MNDQTGNNGESLYRPPTPDALPDNTDFENKDNSDDRSVRSKGGQTDTFIQPESTPQDETREHKGWSTKNKVLAIAGITAAIGAGVGGMFTLGQGKDKPVKPAGGTTATASPSASGKADTAESDSTTPEVVPTPTKNPTEYATSMEQYKNMDVNTFEMLPRDERLAYSQYINDTLIFAGNYQAKYEFISNNQRYGVKNYVASPENSGQEIVDSNLYQLQLAYLHFTQPDGNFGGSETGDNPNMYNLSDGRKSLSSVYYNVGEQSTDNPVTRDYQYVVAQLETLNDTNTLENIQTVKDTSELMTGTIQGNTVQYKDITFEDSSGNNALLFDRYVLTDYPDYTGHDDSVKKIWLLETRANTAEERDSLSAVE